MSTTSVIRVIVADDHPAIRRGVVSILSEMPGCLVVGEAGSADEVLGIVGREAADVLMLDLGMPGARGFDLVRAVRRVHPRLGILVFSMQREEEFAMAALKAGASGFLSKTAAPDELRSALRTIASGRRYISAAMIEALVESAVVPEELPPHHALSERELEVLCLLAQGSRMAEIAERLGISAKTVHTYRTRIVQKLGVRTNVDLALYAVAHNLIGSVDASVTYESPGES